MDTMKELWIFHPQTIWWWVLVGLVIAVVLYLWSRSRASGLANATMAFVLYAAFTWFMWWWVSWLFWIMFVLGAIIGVIALFRSRARHVDDWDATHPRIGRVVERYRGNSRVVSVVTRNWPAWIALGIVLLLIAISAIGWGYNEVKRNEKGMNEVATGTPTPGVTTSKTATPTGTATTTGTPTGTASTTVNADQAAIDKLKQEAQDLADKAQAWADAAVDSAKITAAAKQFADEAARQAQAAKDAATAAAKATTIKAATEAAKLAATAQVKALEAATKARVLADKARAQAQADADQPKSEQERCEILATVLKDNGWTKFNVCSVDRAALAKIKAGGHKFSDTGATSVEEYRDYLASNTAGAKLSRKLTAQQLGISEKQLVERLDELWIASVQPMEDMVAPGNMFLYGTKGEARRTNIKAGDLFFAVALPETIDHQIDVRIEDFAFARGLCANFQQFAPRPAKVTKVVPHKVTKVDKPKPPRVHDKPKPPKPPDKPKPPKKVCISGPDKGKPVPPSGVCPTGKHASEAPASGGQTVTCPSGQIMDRDTEKCVAIPAGSGLGTGTGTGSTGPNQGQGEAGDGATNTVDPPDTSSPAVDPPVTGEPTTTAPKP